MNNEEKMEENAPNETPAPEGCDVSFLEKLQKEAGEYKDKYLRQLAETENMRKRMIKEKQDSLRYSIDSILAEILIPLDNFENALKIADSGNVSPDVKNWAVGFQMILGQFKEFLSQNGVSEFNSIGAPFDPNKHQALEVEETNDHPEGIVLTEFVKGYSREDRTIRPARVKVSAAKKTAKEETLTEESKKS